MSKKSIFFCCALLATGGMSAQKLAEGYIKMPDSGSLNVYVNAWNSGKGTITMDGKTWEDEEFFTSRVKPKTRQYDTYSQVRPDLVQYDITTKTGNDKRYLNWVPINDPAFNAIPNGTWDQEVFSCWSYVDHWGDWTSPYGWVPGAFSDVCHKNGVATSGVASVPNSSIGSWATTFEGVISAGVDKVGDFLYYHGVDGLGYNSEWTSGWSPKGKGLTTLHANLMTYMSTRNPLWENVWYNGVMDGGGLQFDYAITTSSAGELMKGTSMFMNYNWNNTSNMNTSINTMKNNVGRSPFFIYAGMDQQGGQPKSGDNYPVLKNYQYSIGIWGAHSYNMFWEGRGSFGSSVEATQAGYLNKCEMWYTGGKRNPAIKQTIQTVRNHHPVDSWAGISSMVSERSVFNWDITKEPFITYFNLGNGKFFNIDGVRKSDNPWYSIAMQDYLPTWRFWFAPTWKGGQGDASVTLQPSDQTMDARFTWDDAYFGGSCLKITGSGNQFLHLFKTNFNLAGTNYYTLTYKILGGKADIKLILDGFRQNGTTYTYIEKEVVSVDGCEEIENVSYKPGKDGWTTISFEVKQNDNMRQLRIVGLQFANAQNLEMLLGGFSIMPAAPTYVTPAAPTLKTTKILANTYTGVDAKLIWEMPGKKALPTPTYNSDVNTQYFRMYAQEEGGEPVFVGATTSWAGIAFRSPNTDSSKKIRFGVSAVGFNYEYESAITWSDYFAKGSYVASDEVVLNKSIIKANEDFIVGYVDENHASSTWTIVNTDGTAVKTGSGAKLDVTGGLPLGLYDLYIDKGTAKERLMAAYIAITSDASGAVPELYSISRDGQDVTSDNGVVEIELTDHPTLSYTGRPADGSTSRALALAGRYIGANVGDLGISGSQSISIAGWFKFNSIPEKEWNFMNISNKSASWPQNTWGWCWNHGLSDGTIQCVFRGAASDNSAPGELHYTFPNTVLQAGVWTHIAFVCAYDGNYFRCQLYINGKLQNSRVYQYATGNVESSGGRSVACKNANTGATSTQQLNWTTDASGKVGSHDGNEWWIPMNYAISNNDDVYFGGAAHMGSSIDGLVDDFQIWGSAMTAADVQKSMSGIDASNIGSTSIISLWDFESECGTDYKFTGIGSKPTKASSYDWNGEAQNGNMTKQHYAPTYDNGCPMLAGTAYPIVTTATWKDADDRKTSFVKATSRAATEGEAGSATVGFANAGDHNISVAVANNYGEATMTFPTFRIEEVQGIGDINVDGGEMTTYTVENTLFLEFAADGRYDVEVYNMAGMLVGAKSLDAVAGQNARITLGAAGVYMVKASLNGKALRTIKVLSK